MENVEQIVAQNTERDAVVATAPKADLSKLSNDPWLQENVNTFEAKVAEEKIEVAAEQKIVEDEKANADLEITKTPEEILAEANPIVEETPLSIEGEELSIENDEVADDSWISLAKSQGLEITEDSVEAFVEAKTKPLLEQIEAVNNKKMEDYFVNLNPQTRMEIELQNAGYSLEEIKAPIENIAKYRSMDAVALYREDLTLKIEALRELTDSDRSFIDTEVERVVESGEINHEHKKLMLMLDESENALMQQRQQIIDKFKVNNARNLEEKRNSEIESVSKALNEIPSFMGSTIKKESISAMARKYGEGKYDQIFNDPAKRAEFIMYQELGKKAYETAIAKSEAKGLLSVTKKLHNTPPLDNVGQGMNTTPQEQLTGLNKLRNEPGLK